MTKGKRMNQIIGFLILTVDAFVIGKYIWGERVKGKYILYIN